MSEFDFGNRDKYNYLQSEAPYESKHSKRNESNFEDNVDELDQRHADQLVYSKEVEDRDDGNEGWMKDKKKVIRLTDALDKRKQNHSTYKKSIETNKVLYNRERHRTMILSAVNLLALGGCAYIWMN